MIKENIGFIFSTLCAVGYAIFQLATGEPLIAGVFFILAVLLVLLLFIIELLDTILDIFNYLMDVERSYIISKRKEGSDEQE